MKKLYKKITDPIVFVFFAIFIAFVFFMALVADAETYVLLLSSNSIDEIQTLSSMGYQSIDDTDDGQPYKVTRISEIGLLDIVDGVEKIARNSDGLIILSGFVLVTMTPLNDDELNYTTNLMGNDKAKCILTKDIANAATFDVPMTMSSSKSIVHSEKTLEQNTSQNTPISAIEATYNYQNALPMFALYVKR